MMKRIIWILVLLSSCGMAFGQTVDRTGDKNYKGSATIGTNSNSYTATDTSAWLQIGKDSTDKGMILPRVVDTSNIDDPVKGLFVFQNKDSTIYYYTDEWKPAGGNYVTVNTDQSITGFKTFDTSIIVQGAKIGSIRSSTPGFDISPNTFIGDSAMYVMDTSSDKTLIGFANFAGGSDALYSNTTGSANFAGGFGALYSNTTGNGNFAGGYQALLFNTTGNWNFAGGSDALYSNTTGSANFAGGFGALYSNTTGNYNFAGGSDALYSNTTGNYNFAGGSDALYSNTTGSANFAGGFGALYSNTTGSGKLGIGVDTLLSGDSSKMTILGNMFARTLQFPGYLNNATEDSVLTTDEAGNLKLKYLSYYTKDSTKIVISDSILNKMGYADTSSLSNRINNKVDKVSGKGLSTNDYTTTEKTKLSGIESGAEVNVNSDWEATSGDAEILNKPDETNFNVYNQNIDDAVTVSTTTKTSIIAATSGNLTISNTDQYASYVGHIYGSYTVSEAGAGITISFAVGNRELSTTLSSLSITGTNLPFDVSYVINFTDDNIMTVIGVVRVGSESVMLTTTPTVAITGNSYNIYATLTEGTLTINSSYLHRNVK